MGRYVEVLAVAFVAQVDEAQGPQGVDNGDGRLLGAGEADVFQVVETVGDVIADLAVLALSRPEQDEEMGFGQVLDLLVEEGVGGEGRIGGGERRVVSASHGVHYTSLAPWSSVASWLSKFFFAVRGMPCRYIRWHIYSKLN